MPLAFIPSDGRSLSQLSLISSHRDRYWRDGGLPNLRVVGVPVPYAPYVFKCWCCPSNARTVHLLRANAVTITPTQAWRSWTHNYLIAFQLVSERSNATKGKNAVCGAVETTGINMVSLICAVIAIVTTKKIRPFLEVIVIILTLQKSHADNKLCCEDPALS